MKVVAINGSPRKNGNTSIMIKKVFSELEAEGIETEMIQLGGNLVHGCTGCRKCAENKDKECVIKDTVNDCIKKMVEADGIIVGSPTYVANVSTEVKALIDRATVVGRSNNQMYKNKVGASLVAVRRAGAVNVFSAINYLFFISEMIVPGSTYWNLGIGGAVGQVEEDLEGMNNMTNLGKNIAWLLKKIV
jgi:multimeric flavodoxin WrbA